MKYLVWMAIFIVAAATAGSMSGCVNTTKTDTTDFYNSAGKKEKTQTIQEVSKVPTADKYVSLIDEVNAIACSMYDPVSGNLSPYLKLGFFKFHYTSMPVQAGQPIFVQTEEYSSSWWNWVSFFSSEKKDDKTNIVKRVTMWIGTVPKDGQVLTVKTKTGPGMTISGEGFESEALKVTMEQKEPSTPAANTGTPAK